MENQGLKKYFHPDFTLWLISRAGKTYIEAINLREPQTNLLVAFTLKLEAELAFWMAFKAAMPPFLKSPVAIFNLDKIAVDG